MEKADKTWTKLTSELWPDLRLKARDSHGNGASAVGKDERGVVVLVSGDAWRLLAALLIAT